MLSDQGTEFMSNAWVQLQTMIGCDMHHSSPYHPQENSMIERSHRTISNIVWATLLDDHHLTWCNVLPAVQLMMNSAEHLAYTYPPSQLILGTNLHLPVDCHLPCAVPKPTLIEKDHVTRLRGTLAACQTVAKRYVSTPAYQAPNPYALGDLILVAFTPREWAHKLNPRWQGPFKVTGIPH